ncbi:hypothetical protein LNAOJCKE_2275 [Methylorubrum aminovorans]|uniref:DNA2/NAM7 helicase helicase domain-containing protein n=1 Tax=Methylorubrum aminovorans TaxID=269069 RepID=A0ABQ4UE22_9HYPH|nr:DUF4011 domain-containing protein [Methylorubrum aminovorans]GJE65067.1 hypothetical protein LNAOJCKE_2275 [Methylorubrum aminovorans]GMA74507.1 hypothetical protein GCM10025880_09240 [Methylorubrum aminovorans]
MVQRSLEELAAPLRDVSRWNRLLSLPSDRRSGYLGFAESARSVRDALSRSKRVAFSEPVLTLRNDWSSAEPGTLDADEALRRMVRLDGLARDIDEETGVSPLMLGLGLVLWRDGERVRIAPLMLCPVILDGVPEGPGLRRAGVPVANPVLLDRLEIDPACLPSDPLTWRAEDLAGHGVVSVSPVAVLGIFDVVRYRQWERLDARRDPRLAKDPRVQALLTGEGAGVWSGAAKRALSREARMATSLDRSQAVVLEASRQGSDLAVQAGPGTGKTQTIVHILGNAVRDRRTVLFLSGRQSAFRSALARLDGLLSYGCPSIGQPRCKLYPHRTKPAQSQPRPALAARGFFVSAPSRDFGLGAFFVPFDVALECIPAMHLAHIPRFQPEDIGLTSYLRSNLFLLALDSLL